MIIPRRDYNCSRSSVKFNLHVMFITVASGERVKLTILNYVLLYSQKGITSQSDIFITFTIASKLKPLSGI